MRRQAYYLAKAELAEAETQKPLQLHACLLTQNIWGWGGGGLRLGEVDIWSAIGVNERCLATFLSKHFSLDQCFASQIASRVETNQFD